MPSLLAILLFTLSSFSATESSSETQERLKHWHQRASELKLWEDREWYLLGFYDRRLFGNLKSRGTESFFLAPGGDTNPRLELEASISQLLETKDRSYPGPSGAIEKQIPRCQFPARFRWLQKRLGIQDSELPAIQCEGLSLFRQRMKAQSVSVVFSSFFLNSPSSSFGHSLLRVSPLGTDQPDSSKLELLDFGFGFAANQTTPNPILYALYGIGGIFRGTYTNVPYYYKVREYNDFESRDLWSYDLNLTADERIQLVDRLWEVASTYHDYYYFTLNCSNVILHALETAAPRYRILDELKFYVIPSDTIKAIMRVPGLVSRIRYRPSAYSVFQHRISQMNTEEKGVLQSVIESDFSTSSLERVQAASATTVLDAAADFIDYRYAKEVTEHSSSASRWRQNVLIARAKIPEKSRSFEDFRPENQRPDLGHESMKISLLGGREERRGTYGQLNLRFALHDLLDPDAGYPPHSQLEMMGFKFRLETNQSRFRVEDLNFFRLMTLAPLTQFDKNTSWRAEFGAKRIRDENCDRCFATVAEFARGYSVQPFSVLTIYGMGEVGLRFSPSFIGSDLQFGVGPLAGLEVRVGDFGVHTSAKYLHQIFSGRPHTRVYSADIRYNVGTQYSFGVDAKKYVTSWDLGASIGAFF